MQELRMLPALHGIGVLQLDAENPSESNILIPARGRSDVDWSTSNRLVTETRTLRISSSAFGSSIRLAIGQ